MRLVLLPLALALALLRPVSAQELRERDHIDLGKLVNQCLEKWEDPEDKEKAVLQLQSALEKIGKPRAGKEAKPADSLKAALRLTADLQLAAYKAIELKNLKGGEIVELPIPGGAPHTFAVRAPNGYKFNEARFPLILCVPGMKDGKPWAPDQFLLEHLIEKEYHDRAILAAVGMPADAAQWSQVSSEKGGPTGVALIMWTLNAVREKYAVDFDRVVLYGRELGVETCMHVGSLFPHLFAGVIGTAGDAGDVGWENFRNLPTLLLGGGAKATAFDEKIRSGGYNNCTLKAGAPAAEVAAWIQDHARVAHPAKVTLAPGSPIPTRAYWVEVPAKQSEPGTVVVVEVDRGTNTVKIDGKGVDQVILYLNDVLVDLDLPVKVALNGQAQETVIPRSLDVLLTTLFKGTGDPARLYVARRAFALPRKP